MAEDMFDNGSFLRRRKRYKRTNLGHHHHHHNHQNIPFPAIYGSTFSPFWVRKPVPVIPGHQPSLSNFGQNPAAAVGGLMNYRDNLNLFSPTGTNNFSENSNKKSLLAEQAFQANQFKISPERLEMFKKSYSNNHHYNSVLNAIRRNGQQHGNFLEPEFQSMDNPYLGHKHHLEHPVSDEDEDIDLMDDEDESNDNKIDIESECDEFQAATILNLNKRHRDDETVISSNNNQQPVISDSFRDSDGGFVNSEEQIRREKREFEETTLMEFDLFNKKRKFSSVKGFSIDNIIGQSRETAP